MIYFYTEHMSTSSTILTYLFQTTPSLIVYLVTLKYCFPTKFSRYSVLLISIPAYNLGWIFNDIVRRYFQEILVIHNIFSIICQFVMVLILYIVFNRGERLFLVDLLIVTCFTILSAAGFEYIRVFFVEYLYYTFVFYKYNQLVFSILINFPAANKKNFSMEQKICHKLLNSRPDFIVDSINRFESIFPFYSNLFYCRTIE